MFKKIVVPLDGSDTAEKALVLAADLADPQDAEILLLRVSDFPIGSVEYGGLAFYNMQADCEKIAEQYLQTVKESIKSGPSVKTKLVSGHPVESLLRESKAFAADLVVMTSHGKSNLERWVMGTTAENFARRCPCPVLVTRSGKPFEVPLGKKVMVALDGSKLAEKVLPIAAAMVKRAQGELILFRSNSQQSKLSFEYATHDIYPPASDVQFRKKSLELAQEYLEKTAEAVRKEYSGFQVSTAFSELPAAEAILNEAEQQGVDLLAMTSHGATGPGKWFFGSDAERVLRHATRPILIVRSDWEASEST